MSITGLQSVCSNNNNNNNHVFMTSVCAGEWFSPDLMSLVTGTLITVQFAFIFVAVQVKWQISSIADDWEW